MAASAVAVAAPAQAAPKPPTKCQVENLATGARATNLATLVATATSGQTIQVKGVCPASLQLSIDLTFVGKATAAVPVATIDARRLGRAFVTDVGVSLTLRNLRVLGGSCGEVGFCAGDVAFTRGPFTAIDVTFAGNRPGEVIAEDEQPSSIHASRSAVLDRVTFTGHVGRAMYTRGPLVVRNSTFDHNKIGIARLGFEESPVVFEGENVVRDNLLGIYTSRFDGVSGYSLAPDATVTFSGNTVDCEPAGLIPGC